MENEAVFDRKYAKLNESFDKSKSSYIKKESADTSLEALGLIGASKSLFQIKTRETSHHFCEKSVVEGIAILASLE